MIRTYRLKFYLAILYSVAGTRTPNSYEKYRI